MLWRKKLIFTVLNHKAFIERGEHILSARSIPGHCFLFYADIADFQLVNRYYGMEKGDALLSAIEAYLRCIQEVAVYERVLSDQFLFLVITGKPTTNEQIKAYFHDYAATFSAAQKELFPNLSIKIACGIYAMKSSNFVDAIDGANMARKAAKRKGCTAPVVFDHAVLDEIWDYHREEQQIALALREKRFTFFLQPKVDLLTGRIIGAEALARRISSEGEVIPPGAFLHIMEANGSIVDLDILIFEQVCEHLAERLKNRLPVVRTSVNLSRLHIQNADTAAQLHAIAAQYAVPPELIEFELTETILLNEFEDAKALIDQLRERQYHVSIDDFGSGYAGINIWQELNFDLLKLDRRFLSDNAYIKSRNTAIVPNVINIAQRLDIDVICEGVETGEQCEYLLQLGCTAVQGFYFSRPMPGDAFYDVYVKQQGFYPLAFKAPGNLPDERPGDAPQKKASRQKPFRHVLLMACCSFFLALCVIATLGVHRGVIKNMFEESIRNNLDGYASSQAAIINAKIENITKTMNAFAIMLSERNDAAFIDAYLSALNQNEPDVTFVFSTAEAYEAQMAQGTATALDIECIRRIQHGETVVSGIVFSERAGNVYCFSIGVPILIDGVFTGGLRAVVDASLLCSIDRCISPYGDVTETVVVDGDGIVLLTNNSNSIHNGDSIFDLLRSCQSPESAFDSLRLALSFHESVSSIYIGDIDGIPHYLSVADLKYNGWNGLVIFRAEQAHDIISNLLTHTISSIVVLMIAILIVCVIITLVLQRWRKKADSNTERYLLLEQFSDTVLFDYDCRTDTIRFTPNAEMLFHVDEWTHKGLLARLASISNIYPADCPAIEAVLRGTPQGNRPEIRIRIKHPSDSRYYWCLIQYKYIYADHRLASIIGKILDIDEQQRRENLLAGQALRDGMTGLLNKSATQEQIVGLLQQNKPGLMFMIDVDNFKQRNDTYGHAEGDKVLRAVSDSLRQTFRSNDIIGRFGGDEFLVYMHDVSDSEIIHQKMDALSQLLSAHSAHLLAPLSISVGASGFPEDGCTFEALYQIADQALYAAKQNGKNQYCCANTCHPFRCGK